MKKREEKAKSKLDDTIARLLNQDKNSQKEIKTQTRSQFKKDKPDISEKQLEDAIKK